MELSGTYLHLLKEDVELTMSFVQNCTPLHHQKSILLKMLPRFFSVTILLRKCCCVQTCKVDGLLHNGMRFDDKRTRAERLKQDKLGAFNYICGLCIRNCKTQSLGAYTTVDEQLVPFRGRCLFTQYMPSKPAKYGIKIFWLCDPSLPYAFNAKIYIGRQPGSAPEKNLGHNVVVNLTALLQDSRRNVSMDDFFTSVPVARTLLQHQLTVVRIMRKCKREIPVCMKAAKSQETKTSVFGFKDQLRIVSYVLKKNKALIFFSTMHYGSGSQTVRRDAPVSGFNFPRASRDHLVLCHKV